MVVMVGFANNDHSGSVTDTMRARERQKEKARNPFGVVATQAKHSNNVNKRKNAHTGSSPPTHKHSLCASHLSPELLQ